MWTLAVCFGCGFVCSAKYPIELHMQLWNFESSYAFFASLLLLHPLSFVWLLPVSARARADNKPRWMKGASLNLSGACAAAKSQRCSRVNPDVALGQTGPRHRGHSAACVPFAKGRRSRNACK